jgi:hypothetical protein
MVRASWNNKGVLRVLIDNKFELFYIYINEFSSVISLQLSQHPLINDFMNANKTILQYKIWMNELIQFQDWINVISQITR